MRLWLSITIALHLFIGAAMVSWAPFQSVGSATGAVVGQAEPAASGSPSVAPVSLPVEDGQSLASAISLALADLPVEMSEVLSASPQRQPAHQAHPAPRAIVHAMWTSATSDGLLRPPKALTSV